MTTKRLAHGSFTLERDLTVPPKVAFRAWSDLDAKEHWFNGPEDWILIERSLDLRIGGKEVLHGRHPKGVGNHPSGTATLYTAHYHDIVPDTRLVYAYDMHLNDIHLSVSLSSVEFEETSTGSRMKYVEQAVYLDGDDDTEARSGGTESHFDLLETYLNQL